MMKKLLMVMVTFAACVAAQAMEMGDTIVIVNGDTVKHVKDGGKKADKYKLNDFLDLDVAFGAVAPLGGPDNISFGLRPHEWTLGLRYKFSPKKSLQTYSVGLWCKWARYTLKGDELFYRDDATKEVLVDKFPDTASDKYASIHIFSLSVPFFVTQRLGKKSDWKLTLGPVLNFNVKGSLASSYEVGDYEYENYVKGIKYRPVTIDIMGMVTYKEVSVYFKYAPMNVLKKDKGPQFHSLSFGVFL